MAAAFGMFVAVCGVAAICTTQRVTGSLEFGYITCQD
jgi:hypothetical protein